MAVEISPEPTEDERRAILAALALEPAERAEPAPWRRAALAPEDAADERDQAGAPPRQSRGATRT